MKSALALTAVIFTFLFVSIPLVFSDNEERWGDSEYSSKQFINTQNPVYREECGSCHMAYPAGLLPARSWDKLMAGLDDHFGDNAELLADTHKVISNYLSANSADHQSSRLSRKFFYSIDKNSTPLRITDLAYFQHKHDEIPARMVVGNKKVNSFSHCNSCHTGAEKGSFNDNDVTIPGYGRWDD